MEADALIEVVVRLLDAFDHTGAYCTQKPSARWMPGGVFELLVAQGFLVAAGTNDKIVCDNCDRLCMVRVRRRRGTEPPAFEFRCCRDEVLMDATAEQLIVWRWSPDAVARLLAKELNLVGSLTVLTQGLFRLGERRIARKRVEFYLAHGLSRKRQAGIDALTALPPNAVVFTGSIRTSLPLRCPDWTLVSVDQLLVANGDAVKLDPDLVETAVGFRPSAVPITILQVPPGTAWTKVLMRVMDDTTIHAFVGKSQWVLHPHDLGLMGMRGGKPLVRLEWQLLVTFGANRGELDRDQAPARTQFREQLSVLREALCRTFGISDDPFRNYRTGGCDTHFLIAPWDSED